MYEKDKTKPKEPNMYSPEENHDTISITKQPDGNWIGEMWRFGKVVSVRQYDPQIVLQMLLTHNGE